MQIFFHPTVPTGPGILLNESGSYHYAQIVGEPDSCEGAKTVHAALGYLVERNRERFELLPLEKSLLNEAAPDLLAALKNALKFIDLHRHASGGDGDLAAAEARAAIAKATAQ